jgi:Cas6b C-terminal domain/Cas6b N-terminal domain
MFLRIFTLVLEPESPVRFSITELRAYFSDALKNYTDFHKDNATGFIHRYPAVQCKMIKNTLMVVGINQGADLLEQISRGRVKISPGENACSIVSRDTAVREEQFGLSDNVTTYEFLTPWLALNQQNTKKFYDLKGKPERDAFLQKLLSGGLGTLAKSLDYKPPSPVSCEEKVRFRKDWIDNKSVMVFVGKFRTNLQIPDYLGMGQAVSLGFGTIRQIPDSAKNTGEDAVP